MLPAAVRAFQRAGVQLDVVMTEAPGHGGRVARERAGEFDFVFSLGGDGTAMEIVNALSGTDRAISVLPGGTGNLLARALGTPMNVGRAVTTLLKGTARRIDLGVLGDGRCFAVGAGAGVDAAMLAGAPLARRQRYGVGAYVMSAARELAHPTPFSVRATVDGRVIEREDCVLALAVNVGVVLNGLLHLGPSIKVDDGALDLCVYSARHFADAVVVASRLALRRFRDDRRTAFARGRCVTIETDPPVRTQADGELLGVTPLTASVSPLAALLQVAQPAR